MKHIQGFKADIVIIDDQIAADPRDIQTQIDKLRRLIANSPDSYHRREAQADLDFLLKLQKDTA